MRITALVLVTTLSTLAACPGGGGDDTGTGTAASTTGTASQGTTSAGPTTTEATTGATSGTTSGMTSGTTTSGPGTTTEATTTEATTTSGPGTTTEATTTSGPGSTGEASTTGGPVGGECKTDADCKLHDDCCSCYGNPIGQDDPICKALCDKSKCEQAGVDQAVCRFGVCTTEKVKCSGEVACDALPPDCPPGELPGKTDACWTGGCVPAAACDAVPDCSLCPQDSMCVELQSQIVVFVCEPIPWACEDAPNCGCAGDLACEDPFTECQNGNGKGGEVVCSCPTC